MLFKLFSEKNKQAMYILLIFTAIICVITFNIDIFVLLRSSKRVFIFFCNSKLYKKTILSIIVNFAIVHRYCNGLLLNGNIDSLDQFNQFYKSHFS